MVDSVLSEQIIARHVLFLAYAVAAVFALAAVGICPRKFHKGDGRGGGEGKADAGGFDGADCEAGVSGLKAIHSGLFLDEAFTACNCDGFRELFLEGVDDIMIGAEDNEWFVVGKVCADEVDGLFHFAFGRQ